MATCRAIITDALTEINVLAQGNALQAYDAQLGLLRLQNQIDAWGADRLTIAVNTRVTFTLASGENTKTIGAGGDINTPRPIWFTGANYIIPGTNPEVEVPLGQMDDDSYTNLSIKALASSLPQQFYYNDTTPLGTLFFWPTVTQDVDIALYLPQGVGVPATLDSTLIGPAGYQEAFMYQLAIRLCGPYSRPIDPSLREMAAEAYKRMQRPNVNPGLLGVDQALVPSYGGAYNVLSDTTSGSSNR